MAEEQKLFQNTGKAGKCDALPDDRKRKADDDHEDSPPRRATENECNNPLVDGNKEWHASVSRYLAELYRLSCIFDPLMYEDAYGYSVKMLWKINSYPYPSVKQLEAVLPKNLNASRSTAIFKVYQKCFPWVGSSSVPRSLLHLCRCTIKKYLRCDDDVDKLFIPETLKDYFHLCFIWDIHCSTMERLRFPR